MPQRANITSLDAIQAFRTDLLVFLGKARPALDEAGGEVLRLRNWLHEDQRTHWEGQMRRRSQQLEEAESVLFGARLSKFQEPSAAQQAAVHKARRAVAEAEAKLRMLRRWERDYENRTQPLLKQQEKLSNLLALDIPNAVAHLNEVIDTLQKYANIAAPAGPAAAAPPAPGEAPGPSPETTATAQKGNS